MGSKHDAKPYGTGPAPVDVAAFSVKDDGNFCAKVEDASFSWGSNSASEFLILRKGPKDWNPAAGSYFVIWRDSLLIPQVMWNYAHTRGRAHFKNLDEFGGLDDQSNEFIPPVKSVRPVERPLTVQYDGQDTDTQGPRKGPYYVLQLGFHYSGKKGLTAPKDL
jgi:hypothetical protein